MRLLPRALVCALLCPALFLAACDDGEPPPLDAGFDAGLDGLDTGTGTPDVTTHVDTGTPKVDSGRDSSTDVTVHDGSQPDVKTDVTQAPDSGACGTGGASCGTGTKCVSGACRAAGEAAGELCGTGNTCPAGSICGSNGYCTVCGGAGQACCTSGCSSEGCCVAGICTPEGSVCPYADGQLCEGASCGNGCPDGGCDVCGGPGQNCCATIGCTAGDVDCVTTADSTKVCEACGGAGESCCGGTACTGSLVCADSTCSECGGPGEPACAGQSATDAATD